MQNLEGTLSPTVKTVSVEIRKIISNTLEELERQGRKDFVMSHIEGPYTTDSWTCSVSFALCEELLNEKTLNFFVVQDIKTREIAVIITTGEKEGLRILYKSINKYPIPNITKYLPNIIISSINILSKNNI